jgi:hypothetical protein
MSVRFSLLRDALAGMIDAASDLPQSSTALIVASGKAILALHSTRFVAPENFPVVVSTRAGISVTLFALHDGQLIGAFRDTDVGGLDLRHWNSDGTMFGAGDPDPLDLVLADDTIETPPAKRHREPTDSVVVPILGRIS